MLQIAIYISPQVRESMLSTNIKIYITLKITFLTVLFSLHSISCNVSHLKYHLDVGVKKKVSDDNNILIQFYIMSTYSLKAMKPSQSFPP